MFADDHYVFSKLFSGLTEATCSESTIKNSSFYSVEAGTLDDLSIIGYILCWIFAGQDSIVSPFTNP